MSRSQTPCSSFIKSLILSSSVAAGLLMYSQAPAARAETPEECQHRIAHAEHELHEAIEHHGAQSHQADHERRELHEARERCWRENHRWWDEHEHRWHEERDWDDHDHDRP